MTRAQQGMCYVSRSTYWYFLSSPDQKKSVTFFCLTFAYFLNIFLIGLPGKQALSPSSQILKHPNQGAFQV